MLIQFFVDLSNDYEVYIINNNYEKETGNNYVSAPSNLGGISLPIFN